MMRTRPLLQVCTYVYTHTYIHIHTIDFFPSMDHKERERETHTHFLPIRQQNHHHAPSPPHQLIITHPHTPTPTHTHTANLRGAAAGHGHGLLPMNANVAPLPSSCTSIALPTFMLITGDAVVDTHTLTQTLTDVTFPSIFEKPLDFCGVKVSEVITE
jgi:hypothetical protein